MLAYSCAVFVRDGVRRALFAVLDKGRFGEIEHRQRLLRGAKREKRGDLAPKEAYAWCEKRNSGRSSTERGLFDPRKKGNRKMTDRKKISFLMIPVCTSISGIFFLSERSVEMEIF